MAANLFVIICLLILAGLASWKIIKDRKNGIGSCGHSCSNCSSHDGCQCHVDHGHEKELQEILVRVHAKRRDHSEV